MNLQEMEVRLKTLEEKLAIVQDLEEIKNLQKIYGYYLERWQWKEVMELFSDSPDTSIEINNSGVFIGKDSIKRYFYRESVPSDFLHVLMQVNDVVHVDPSGKTAKGRWYGFGLQAITSPAQSGAKPVLSSGIYENEYVKEDGNWKFKKILWSRIFWCPYEDGWVKTPVISIPGRPKATPDKPTTTYFPYPSGYLLPYHFKNPISGK
jgi:hypothetical protein